MPPAAARSRGIPLTEKRPGLCHQWQLHRGHHLRRPGPRPQRGRRGPHQRLLEPVEKHRPAGPRLWPSREILLRHLQDQLGVGHHHHPGRPHPALHRGHLPAGTPARGRVVTGGIVSCQDSSWLLSWTINRQGQFKEQDPGKVCVWGLRPVHRRAPGTTSKSP